MTDFEFYPNLYFEAAIRELARRHEVIELAGRPTIDMSRKPKPAPRSNQQWLVYINAITTVLNIGKREGWLTLHQSRGGYAALWRLLPRAAE